MSERDDGDEPSDLDGKIQDGPKRPRPTELLLDDKAAAAERAQRMNVLSSAIRAGQELTVIERTASAQWGIPRADVRALIDDVIGELPDEIAVKLKRKPGGAEFARKRRQTEIDRHLAALKKLGYEAPPASVGAPDADDSAEDFADCPDLTDDDPETVMAGTREYQKRALIIAAKKPLTPLRLKRLDLVNDTAARIGITQHRADLEEIAERCETLLSSARPTGALRSEPVPTGGGRAPGARGTRRGPQVVPPDDSTKH